MSQHNGLVMFLLAFIHAWGIGSMTGQSGAMASQSTPAMNATDSLGSGIPASDSLLLFCGCGSIDTVKQCADCFAASGPVLKMAYEMSFQTKTIVRGSCWDFVNEVFKRAGVSKETIFSSSKGKRYANSDDVKAGDWIYHINYSYGNVEHSAIFVCWKDKAKKQAVTLSYVGRNRAMPGRLDEADLRSITSIFRAIPH
jgi:hypothetical protein